MFQYIHCEPVSQERHMSSINKLCFTFSILHAPKVGWVGGGWGAARLIEAGCPVAYRRQSATQCDWTRLKTSYWETEHEEWKATFPLQVLVFFDEHVQNHDQHGGDSHLHHLSHKLGIRQRAEEEEKCLWKWQAAFYTECLFSFKVDKSMAVFAKNTQECLFEKTK